MGSNFTGKVQEDTCKRWDKQRKEYIQEKQPEVIKRYNMSMGGVDKLDFVISIDRIFIKSRKWTLQIITHAVDLAFGFGLSIREIQMN